MYLTPKRYHFKRNWLLLLDGEGTKTGRVAKKLLVKFCFTCRNEVALFSPLKHSTREIRRPASEFPWS